MAVVTPSTDLDAGDELLGCPMSLIVTDLTRRRLHEIRRRPFERAAEPAIETELAAAHRIDDDARAVRRVVHLELQLDVEGNIAEGLALEADERPLAVVEPRHVVGRADVDVLLLHRRRQLRLHAVGLADLLAHQALALEHVEEVGVPAEVELVRVLELDPAFAEEVGQDAMDDGCAHLRLDVVTDDRHAGLAEAGLPVVLAGDEHRHAVHHRAWCFQDLLGVPTGCGLAADRQVVDHDVGAGVLEDLGDVNRGTGRLGDHLGEVLAKPVMGHAPLHGNVQLRDIAELHGVVETAEDRF